MKHVINLPDGGWDLANYFQYLLSVRERMPLEVFSFASDASNYDLRSHHSLHDAWLESLSITEPSSGDRSEVRSIRIDCCYLGPYHDLKIYLTYFGVTDYSLVTPSSFQNSPMVAVGHGDLLIHEVSLGHSGEVMHELQFSRGSVFRISCASFSHRLEQRSKD